MARMFSVKLAVIAVVVLALALGASADWMPGW